MKLQREMELLAQVSAAGHRQANNTAALNNKSEAAMEANAIRTRAMRIQQEAFDYAVEVDKEEGVARREAVRATMEKIKAEATTRLSRSDLLMMTRAVEMKYLMAERVAKRDKIQADLESHKKFIRDREASIEKQLEENEGAMTTPRSNARRNVVRRMHMAIQRQEDCFMVCEWGCSEWIRYKILYFTYNYQFHIKFIL